MAREYSDLAIEAQEIIADMPARYADVLREYIEAIHRRRRELPKGERVTLATDGRNYVSEGMDPATTRGKTWWYVEAIIVPPEETP